MKKIRTVLSLFDGMSTARTAIDNIGLSFGEYYASEVNKSAVRFSKEKYPDIHHLGDVRNWRDWQIDWSKVDLICSWSPCQDLSSANPKRKGLSGYKSSLFWCFVDILNHVKQYNKKVLFLQENVYSMKKADAGIISQALGVIPQMIDSARLTAQSRRRWYWQNGKTKRTLFDVVSAIPNPEDRNIKFADIIESGHVAREKSPTLLANYSSQARSTPEACLRYLNADVNFNRKSATPIVYMDKECENKPRRLTKTEMCRLQGFPDDWMDAEWISFYMASNMLGNGWTLPVIEHIFKHMFED